MQAGAGKALRGADRAGPLRQRLAAPPPETPAWMEQHTRLLKTDNYSRAGLLGLKQRPCFLKLYLAKSPWQRLGFRLGYGRAMRSFDAAALLLRHGLPVPAPRCCLLVPEGVLLLTEAIVDSSDLRALWLAQPTAGQAIQVMRSAGQTLAALHRAGFAHGDCKWSNLLWDGERCYLVDLEAVRRVGGSLEAAGPPRPRQVRDLARFTVDAEARGASQAQYDIFLESYCAAHDSPRGSLAISIQSAAAPIRRRHAKSYGKISMPLR